MGGLIVPLIGPGEGFVIPIDLGTVDRSLPILSQSSSKKQVVDWMMAADKNLLGTELT